LTHTGSQTPRTLTGRGFRRVTMPTPIITLGYTPTLLADSLNHSADRVVRGLGFARNDPFYPTLCMEFKTALKGRLFKGE
jgi:hypothetical protein